jgi:2-methylcitrate dehydratase PrpD
VNEPQVQALLRKVRVLQQPERDGEEPLFSPADFLTVRLRDGSEFKAQPVRRALGHASRPIGDAELRQKFMACATGLPGDMAGRWWDAANAPLDARVAWPEGPAVRRS